MATYRTRLTALWSCFIIIQQIFIELLLYTMLNMMQIVNQIDFTIAPIQRLVQFFLVLSLYVAVFLSELFSTHLISALSPKEATPIILIWALEWQQDYHWFASQVRNECVYMTTEETKILFLDKKLTSSFLFIFEHRGYLNSTEAENIVRVKAVLIKIVCWDPGQICYCKSKRREHNAVCCLEDGGNFLGLFINH